MNKKSKAWIITGSIVGGLALAFLGGCAKGGTLEHYSAKSISKKAYQQEKTATFNGHKFIYFNVVRGEDDGWVLVDTTSYIINTDIQFGFRFKDYDGLVKISAYGDTDEPRNMGAFYADETYTSYQVFHGFKITIDESINASDYGSGFNLGIFAHWC